MLRSTCRHCLLLSPRKKIVALAISLCLPLPALGQDQGFKFQRDEEVQDIELSKRNARVRAQLATPCRARVKNQKIMVLIGESEDGTLNSRQNIYNPYTSMVNDKLQALGLKVYSPQQIKQQIAQAEVDAYLKNDTHAAINASKRLSANFILHGIIDRRLTSNKIVDVNQVGVSMTFSLKSTDGRLISQAIENDTLNVGNDPAAMMLKLVDESAERLVAQLYFDFCNKKN